MRGPNLQRINIFSFTILSFALHLTVFSITFLVLKQSNQILMPSPYTVSLVSPEVSTGPEAREDENVARAVPEPSAAAPEKTKKDTGKEKEMVEKRLSAIAAKRKIEKIVRLRSVIDLKARGAKPGSSVKAASSAHGKPGGGAEDYYSRITKEIWQEWVYPDTGRKDIEAVIAIKILKDGTAIVQKIEKSSGNALFDRSAIRALAKASPLPPPPQEMEIGVRFYP